MRSIALIALIFALAFSGNIIAQTKIEAKPEKWTPVNGKATFDDGVIHVVNTSQESVLVWLNDTNFKNGTIELDIKGKDVRAQSFVGVAFHGEDAKHYDAIYFRPFNFRSPERKEHAVQYINGPDNHWDVLREKFPGKYENDISPAPDPDEWFHAKIVIHYPDIKVYVNGAKKPSLEVKQIGERKEGKFGLWVDSEDGWFKNVVIRNQ